MAVPYLDANDTVAAHRFVACTPSDTTVFEPTRGVYIGTAGATGTVYIDGTDGGVNVAMVGLISGSEYRWQVTRIYATGTDASNIVLLY